MKDPRTLAALLAVQVFFASLPIAAKFALREVEAPVLALLRVSLAAAFFFALQRAVVGERVRGRGDLARLAAYAFFGVAANQLLYVTALTLTTATAAQTFVAVGPALTLLFAVALGRERATAGQWAGIALAAAGALWLVGVGFAGGSGAGNLLALLNVGCYSFYLVISRDLLRRYHPLTVVAWTFVLGAAMILPWGAWALARSVAAPSATAWTALAWIVVVPTVGAYYLNAWALGRVRASVVSVFVYLQPVMTALLAVSLLGERPSPRLLPAAALIFAGVAASTFAARRASPAPPAAAGDLPGHEAA